MENLKIDYNSKIVQLDAEFMGQRFKLNIRKADCYDKVEIWISDLQMDANFFLEQHLNNGMTVASFKEDVLERAYNDIAVLNIK